MSTATLTDQDLRIRDAVTQQLEWDPAVDASAIGVAARGGAVTLTGSINSYAGKLAAERAVKRVAGVRAVANDLEVTLVAGRSDADIAADAATMLKLHAEVPGGVQAAVHHGHVTLTGTVSWHYQRLQAEKAVRFIRGVKSVIDRIAVQPSSSGRDMHKRIAEALHRNATLDARHIEVTVTGSVAHLRGTTTTWLQRDTAERAAYDAPGITMVDNQIVVDPPNDDNCEIC